jgi:pimeloyl-ACP methyl ester carboxylesterase
MEELEGVVLCGHSFAGAVISGAADRIPDRIGALVFLDAFVLENPKVGMPNSKRRANPETSGRYHRPPRKLSF